MVTLCCNDGMTKVETRRARLRMLIAEHGLSELAEKTGKPASQLNDMAAGRKSFGEKIADQLTAKTGLPAGWFDICIGSGPYEKFMGVEPATVDISGADNSAREPLSSRVPVSQSLLSEISAREIPPHIEQAILALLQTCPKAAPKQHTPIFTDEQQMQFINDMRDGLPEGRREDFDNFMKYVSSGGQHQFVSKGGGFISELPPELKRDDDQPRSGDQRDDQLKTSSF